MGVPASALWVEITAPSPARVVMSPEPVTVIVPTFWRRVPGCCTPFGPEPPVVELEGGPVSLAALGVRDGELGLTRTRDVTLEAHLHVELGDMLRGSGTGSLVNVSLRRPEIGAREVRARLPRWAQACRRAAQILTEVTRR